MFISIKKNILLGSLIIIGLFGLVYLSNSNYLLFYTIIEISEIVLGSMIIVLYINFKSYSLEQRSFELLQISYIFITLFGFLHAVFLEGITFFPMESANVSIQLYIIKQYIVSISLFLFVYYYSEKKIAIKIYACIYTVFSCLMLLLVFYWSSFPICFIEGYGETFFKKFSEWIVNIILVVSAIILIKKRENFDHNTYNYLLYSIVFSILMGLCFIFSEVISENLEVMGQILKVVSIYFMYKVIIQVNLISPLIKLQDSKQKYYKMIEELPEAIFVLNNSKIILTNLAGLKILDLEDYDQLKDKLLWDFIDFKDSSMQYKRLSVSQIYDQEEVVILQNSGKRLGVKISTTPYEDKSTMIIMHNISQQNEGERLREKLMEEEQKLKTTVAYEQLKSNFYINITHEFKTPLNVLLAIFQLIEKEEIPENWENYINIAKQNCYRLWRLINNLIDHSKLNTNSFETAMSNQNIVQVVEELTLSVADYLMDSNISIIFDTDVEEKVIRCDPHLIDRILLNLISNGIKFSKEKGNILVNIVDGVDYITIEVEDDGIGIDEENINYIFDAFTKVDDSLTRNNEGCGMGLAIVASLVDIHHGTIEVHSKKGHGSRFVTKIPAKKMQIEQSNIHEIPIHKEKINIEFSDIYC